MIVLWLIIAHLVGDYLFQTRWQANGKFGWTADAMWLRIRHVHGYVAAFVPAAFVYAPRLSGAFAFLMFLAVVHFLTDAQRFKSTPGEWLVWNLGIVSDETKIDAHTRQELLAGMLVSSAPAKADGLRIPPNPWPSIGLAIDQTLHLIQIAVLAELFLT